MKQFLPGLSLSAAFILGCLAATAARDVAVPPARSANAGAYEYTCHRVRLAEVSIEAGPTELLNKYGAEGWRFIPLGWTEHFCFERERG